MRYHASANTGIWYKMPPVQSTLPFRRSVQLRDGRVVAVQPSPSDSNAFPWWCELCKKSFRTHQALIGHATSKEHISKQTAMGSRWQSVCSSTASSSSSGDMARLSSALLSNAAPCKLLLPTADVILPSMVANYVTLNVQASEGQCSAQRSPVATSSISLKKRALTQGEKLTRGAMRRKHRDPVFLASIIQQVQGAISEGVKRPYEVVAEHNKVPVGNMSRCSDFRFSGLASLMKILGVIYSMQ